MKADTPWDSFRDFLLDTEPIRFRDPLAETLGVFKKENAVLEYTFLDVVKLAGHACPTIAAGHDMKNGPLKKYRFVMCNP